MLNNKNNQFLINAIVMTGIPLLLIIINALVPNQIYSLNQASSIQMVLFLVIVVLALIGIVNFLSLLVKKISDLTKRKLYHRIILIIFSFIAILFLVVWPFGSDKVYMYGKSILIYALLLVIVYCLGKMIYDYFFLKIKISEGKQKILKPIFLLMVVILLIAVSQLQIYFIYHYTIPPLYGCSYYDKYNHLIYTSQYEGICPTLENLEFIENENGSELKFSVNEEFYRNEEENENKLIEKESILTNIIYKYDQNHRVTYYKIINILRFQNYPQENITFEKTYIKEIVNTYSENTFTSLHQVSIVVTDNYHPESYVRNSLIEYKSVRKAINQDFWSIKVTSRDMTKPEEVNELYDIINEVGNIYSIKKINENAKLHIDISDQKIQTNYRYQSNNFNTNTIIKSATYLNSFSDSNLKFISNAYKNYKHYDFKQVGNTFTELNKDNDDNFASVIIKTNNGYKIEHYNEKRDKFGKFLEYKNHHYTGGFQNKNKLSIRLETINNYHENLYNIDDYLDLIFQYNPLLI